MSADIGFDVEFGLPDDLFAVEIVRDDDEAARQLRHFVERRCGADASDDEKAATSDRLLAARAALAEDRIVWSGVMSAPIDGEWVLAHFAVAVRVLRAGESTQTLTTDITRRYRDDAVVDPFPTRHCEAVGVRRIGTLIVGDDVLTTAVAQVVCVFDELRGVATVTGIALDLDDLDVTTLIVGAIADTVQLRARASG